MRRISAAELRAVSGQMTLFLKGKRFGHAQFSEFGSTEVLHLWIGRSLGQLRQMVSALPYFILHLWTVEGIEVTSYRVHIEIYPEII